MAAGTPRATIGSVAAAAGLSRQTVSNALNAPDRLRPQTLEHVLRVIDDLDYRPNEAARSLRSRSTRLIGLHVLPEADGLGLHDLFLHALCVHAARQDFSVLAFAAATVDDQLSSYSELLRRNAVDGFVLTSTHPGDPRIPWLERHEVPFATFGRPWGRRSARHSWVDVDGAAGIRFAVGHLADLGHRRIGYLGWPETTAVPADRLSGWQQATAERRLPQHGLAGRAANDIDAAETAAGRLLDQRRPPTALVCASDTLAVGAMHAAGVRGLAVPGDLAISGFDDSAVAVAVRPGLTSIRQPIEAAAAALADDIIAGASGRRSTPLRRLLEPALVVRDSTDPNRTDRHDRTTTGRDTSS